MHIQPYLFFEGRCEEAIEFYKAKLGATVAMLMRYKDSPEPPQNNPNCPPPDPNKVMHATVHVGNTHLLCSDGNNSGNATFKGFALTLNVGSTEEAEQRFSALGEGGVVLTPLTKTFFSPAFGMVADKFGVMWIVLVQR
jgi:PhnB protein